MSDQQPNVEMQNSTTHSSSKKSVRVPPTVYTQFETLRQSGVVNMITEVHEGLLEFDLDEARQWLEANPETYQKGIRVGLAPTDPSAVPEIDPSEITESVASKEHTSTRDDASSDQEQHLLDALESRRRISSDAEAYYTQGSWREVTSLTDEEREKVDLFETAFNCEPNQAYRNALLIAATFGGSSDVVYVEGYAMIDGFNSPLKHAWVELNGKVIELTLPEGPVPDTNAAYLGVEFPHQEVRAKILDEGVAEPLIN